MVSFICKNRNIISTTLLAITCFSLDNLLGFRVLMTWKQFYQVLTAMTVIIYSVPAFIIGLVPLSIAVAVIQVGR